MTVSDWVQLGAAAMVLATAVLLVVVSKANAITAQRNREIARQNVAVAESLLGVNRDLWRGRDGEHP